MAARASGQDARIVASGDHCSLVFLKALPGSSMCFRYPSPFGPPPIKDSTSLGTDQIGDSWDLAIAYNLACNTASNFELDSPL